MNVSTTYVTKMAVVKPYLLSADDVIIRLIML